MNFKIIVAFLLLLFSRVSNFDCVEIKHHVTIVLLKIYFVESELPIDDDEESITKQIVLGNALG